MTGLLLDLRFGFRALGRAPGFAAVAVLTLALGIGANTAIFSFVNALLLRDLPVQAPEKLVWFGIEGGKPDVWYNTLSYRYFELLRDESEAFSGVAAESAGLVAMTVAGRSDEVFFRFASGDYFQVLGVQPTLGRMLRSEDDTPEAPRVTVLSHAFWRSRFGSDPAIVGATVALAGQPYEVVGIAPPEFHGSNIEFAAKLWIPITRAQEIYGGSFDRFGLEGSWLQVFGRIAPGVDREQATAEAKALYVRFGEELLASRKEPPSERMRASYTNPRVRLEPVKAVSLYQSNRYRSTLGMLAGAVGFLLLIACANVANLLLARGVKRRQELAIRAATGASRWRLTRQLLAEGGVLAVLGAALGTLLAWNSGGAIAAMMGERAMIDLRPDPAVLGFTLAVSLASVLVFALVPALACSRINLAPHLKGGSVAGAERGGIGARGWFVAAQFALCLPLLIGSILLVRSARNLYAQDVGFERSQRIQATLDLGGIGYDEESAGALFAELLPAVAAQPGVESAAYSSYGTLTQSGSHRPLYSDVEGAERVQIGMTDVSEGYFETLGLRLLAGREFTARDDRSAPPVVILNETLARELFGNDNPLGRQVRYGPDSPSGFEVVGVAADALYNDLHDPVKPTAYFPFRQRGLRRTNIYLRTQMGAEAAAALLREQARALEPYLPVTAVQTLDEQIEAHLQSERLVSTLLTAFGLTALLITAIGLYGVLAFDVSRRTRELGLRQALGAQRREILGLVFRRAAPWVLAGVALGLAASAALSRVIESSLFGVSALDPLTFAGAAVFLLACAALANFIPARRASRVEPMAALRHD